MPEQTPTHISQALASGVFNKDPILLAQCFLWTNYLIDGAPTLCHALSSFWQHTGYSWAYLSHEEMKYAFIRWYASLPTPDTVLTPSIIRTTIDSLAAMCASSVDSIPFWREPTIATLVSSGTGFWASAPSSPPDPAFCITFRDCVFDCLGAARSLISPSDEGQSVPLSFSGADLSPHCWPNGPEWFDSLCIPSPLTTYDDITEWGTSLDCPNWIAFLQSCSGSNPAWINLLRRWFGYCLLPTNRYEHFLFMYGLSRSGKSTILSVLRALVGEKNFGSTSLSDLGDKDGLQSLLHRRIIAMPDTSPASFDRGTTAVERMKKIIGRDCLYVPIKYAAPLSDYVFPSKLILVSNEMPHLNDANRSIQSKMLMLPFNFSFEGIKGDPHLKDNLLKELPGIARWAVLGAIDLLRADILKQPLFPLPSSSTDAIEVFNIRNNHVRVFLDQCLVRSDSESDRLSNSTLYRLYKQFCIENDVLKPLSSKSLGWALRNEHFNVRKINASSPAGKNEITRVGVRLTPEGQALLSRCSPVLDSLSPASFTSTE